MANYRKEDPYTFWRRIGSPVYVVAPMVDNSELAYRMQTRKHGAQLVYTQMLNSNMLVQASKESRDKMFSTCPEDRPLVVQLAGHDPDIMLQAALLVQDQCDAIDINLGCPQGIAKRGRYGAFLMEELDLLSEIVSTMVKGVKVPIFCKTRIYKDFNRSIKLLETLANAGASALTVHGRTREEKGQFAGQADWDMLRRVKEHFSSLPIPIPIIANGGIENLDDVLRCIEIVKADGVMSSEAILENPCLFQRNIDSSGRELTQVDLTDEYLDFCEKYPPPHPKIMRSHVMKMLYRYYNECDELRDQCAISNSLEQFREVSAFARRLHDSKLHPNMYSHSWYLRYRLQTVQEDGSMVDRVKKDISNIENMKKSVLENDCYSESNEKNGDELGGGIFDGLNLFG